MAEPKIGHFRILRHLGQGSVMNAFLVHNEQENRTSALKILKPALAGDAAAEQFIKAAQASAALAHPCISAALSAGRTGPTVYAETAFLQGRPLREVLKELGTLEPDYCVFLARQAAAMLNFAHNTMRGAAHGGINPGNILLCSIGGRENVPTLTDYGLVNAVLLSESGFNLEAAGAAVAYLSPEQLAGQAPGPAADIYSLGAVLFELLAGKPPFPGNSASEIARMHAGTEPPRLSDVNPAVPPGIDETVWRCLRKNPA
ncbi:serine/threonine-protein kinase, partial [bacterium]